MIINNYYIHVSVRVSLLSKLSYDENHRNSVSGRIALACDQVHHLSTLGRTGLMLRPGDTVSARTLFGKAGFNQKEPTQEKFIQRRNKIYSKKLDATWCNTHSSWFTCHINYVSSCYIIMMSLSDSQPSLPNAQVRRASVPKPGNNSALRANAFWIFLSAPFGSPSASHHRDAVTPWCFDELVSTVST